ncbi:nucleotide exchange factor GrpE [Actinophytocola xanthii]|uniref:nucleotide exchange factor GrpE n=1 Tax=Actinophytocola xanthii TaxID=1912961 RepID=UPI0009F8CF03|nr:nucleotide exchange factor GrpE [Actinophytocola xanthii]
MTSDHRTDENSGEEPRVVVRDRRRIDPQTGQVRPASEEPAPGEPGHEQVTDQGGQVSDEAPSQEAELKAQLDERTADLQRLQAEYANYRKRIDRDREAVVTQAKASVASELLPVLDDIERAAQHGDLTGAFKAVADKLAATLERVGLEGFGHDGEPFDPSVHEAVQHDTSPDVPGPTVTAVLRRGYRFGDRVVRAALVGVTDHEPAAAPAAPGPSAEGGGTGDWFEPTGADTPPAGRADEQN